MNAVGADRVCGCRVLAALEPDFDLCVRLRDGDAPLAEPDSVWLQRPHGFGEQAMQVTSVEIHVAGPVALERVFTKLVPVPGLAGPPVAYLPPRRNDLGPRKRRLEPERIEDAGAIRTDGDAGSHFLEHARLLIDLDIEATPQQRERRRQSTDASADDRDPTGRSHRGSHRTLPR